MAQTVIDLVLVLNDDTPQSIVVGPQPVTIDNGTDYRFNCVAYDLDSNPVDLTGCTLLLSVRDRTPEHNLIVALQATPDVPIDGVAHFECPSTLQLKPGNYDYNVVLVYPQPNPDRVLVLPATGLDGIGNRTHDPFMVRQGMSQPGDPVSVPPTQQPLAQGPPGLGWGTTLAPTRTVISPGAGTAFLSLFTLPAERCARVRIYAALIDPVTGDSWGAEWKGTIKRHGANPVTTPGGAGLQIDGSPDYDPGASGWLAAPALAGDNVTLGVNCTVDRAGVRQTVSMLIDGGGAA